MRNLVWIAALLLMAACGDGGPKVSTIRESLVLDRSELSFGAIFVGGHLVDRVKVQNLGIRDVQVVVEGLPKGFEVEPASFFLAPQGWTTVEVAFRPKEVGTSEGTIAFRAKDSNSRGVELHVDGQGVPRALVAPATLDFGNVRVGEVASLPIELVSETDAPLEVNIRHAAGGVFAVDRNHFDIEPRTTETIVASFAPTVRSPATMTLVLDLCTGCPTIEIVMTGTGLGPKLVASASPLGFGLVAPGLTRSQPLVISNVGDFDVDFGAIETEGRGFGVELEGFPSMLAVGEEAALMVSFSPPGDGERRGTLFVDDTDGEHLLVIPMVGASGGALLEVTPAAVEFDFAVVGVGAAKQKVVLENVLEPEDLELSSVSIEGADADSFAATLASPVPVRPTAALQVKFAPVRVGELSAELVLRTTHTEQAEIRVPLSGIGVEPVPCTLEMPFDGVRFGLVDKGEVNRRDHRIYNVGTEPCPIWGFTTTGPDLNAFYLSTPPPDPVLLRPGAMISIPIELKQSAPRGRLLQASVSFVHSALDAPPTIVPVTAWLAEQSGLIASPTTLIVEPTPIDRATVVSVHLATPLPVPVRVRLDVTERSAFRLHPSQRADLAMTSTDVNLVFRPEELGLAAAELTVSAPELPEPVRVRLYGEGMAPCGDGGCAWPTASCSEGPRPAGWTDAQLTSTVAPSSPPAPGDPTCTWTLVSGEGPTDFRPGFPSACNATLSVAASGGYTSEVLAVDSVGHAAYCQVETVIVPPEAGLWVETFLSSPSPGQVELTILHAGGGDPHFKPSWWDTRSTCVMRGFWQTPPACTWDEPGTEDDPVGLWANFPPVSSSYMRIPSPSVSHAYHVGIGAMTNPTSAPDLRGRIYCGGALVADASIPLTPTVEFLFLGSVTFQPDGSCVFEEDGLSWAGHRICQPLDPHCP